jgi:hypothetical protein
MKKPLLTSIAALFLATGAAHAGCHEWYYRCDNKLVNVQGCNARNPWHFNEVISKEKSIDLPSRAFRLRDRGDAGSGLYFHGRKCSCLDVLNDGFDDCSREGK